MPAELVALLTRRVGLAEHEVAAMTKEEAVARLNQYWSTGPVGGSSGGNLAAGLHDVVRCKNTISVVQAGLSNVACTP
ncbi:MAG TPA: hypothetical protein VEK09_08430 [Jatrophihabitantaceae bacterium]|nr:hypothetical protein [Jatrophihabitantaceae bacterium]